ncbi:similar to Saccharomyces cerevisiae YPL153C RAD53 Protein kinase, required for cell-cycle arrest in response to DNA damage [Maudiozyma saulgeensis]|uniref:Serine/threonine-protein kinase RAD53 n=1 Tax=Maudiozyma saulgeensis TaxID=1789683 RepID=A0A1X7R919_9SACH|nr:similar to Saccharomyces cerevisiae YPL153C RAD53 Protein kinase, required for cell-cycle arrest in response to DNA damage [Kazachstania saulgeensis]
MNVTQPTQQATQATQRFLVEKFSQEQINENIVCRIVCTNGTIPIKDLTIEIQDVLKIKTPIKKVWTFGRGSPPAIDYQFENHSRYSNKHFQIMLGEDCNLLLRDISTNGTILNGERIPKKTNQLLSQGDEITVGAGVASDVLTLMVFISDRFKQAYERARLDEITAGSKLSPGNNTSNSNNSNGIADNKYMSPIYKDFSIEDRVVGQGAFATVKRAAERKTGKTYAVKIINKRKVMGNIDGVTRELEVLEKLEHPRIVRLKAFYEDDLNYYMVMEFVSGGDLMDFVVAHGVVGEDAGREITRQILEAVEYIHSMGISHRDLKPDNILIEQDDPVLIKITDFGLAKVQATESGLKTFCGTLAYVAPEVLNNRSGTTTSNNSNTNGGGNSDEHYNEYSNMVDMWSLGCLVYVILTSHLPFSGNSEADLFEKIIHGSYHDAPLRDYRVSEEAKDFIDSLLQVDVTKRLTAKKALQHPWIRMGLMNIVPNIDTELGSQISQVSLSESMSQQRELENLGDAQYELVKNLRRDLMLKLEEEASQNTKPLGFKVPNIQPMRYTQPGTQPQIASQQSHKPKVQPSNKNKIKKSNNSGLFMTLTPLTNSSITDNIIMRQGVNPYFIGRSLDCNTTIDENRLSRINCFFIKNRHVVGDSFYEAPALGLQDLWYCHTGTNPSFVNGIKIEKGYKILVRDHDIIKIVEDTNDNIMIGFQVNLEDTTGIFIEDRSQDKRNLVEQTPEEKLLPQRLTKFMAMRKAEAIAKRKANDKQKNMDELNSSPAGLIDSNNLPNDNNSNKEQTDRNEHNTKRSHDFASKNEQIKKAKRAVLNQETLEKHNNQFM